jgi:hypothetical protein
MMWCGGIAIGTNPLFCWFIWRPERLAKLLRTSIMVERFWGCAGVKMIASSANCRSSVLHSAIWMRFGCTLSIRVWRDCITSMKSSGESGSPCFRPRMWKKLIPYSPLIRTNKDGKIRRLWIQVIHRSENSAVRMSERIKSQDIVSNAFRKSILSSIEGILVL